MNEYILYEQTKKTKKIKKKTNRTNYNWEKILLSIQLNRYYKGLLIINLNS